MKKAIQFIELIDNMRDIEPILSISDLLEYILENSGLKPLLRLSGEEERLENINELAISIKQYEEQNSEEEIGVKTYLQDIALYTNADYRRDCNTVKLMTIHQSKGLEFPYVFIIGTSDGIIPNAISLYERDNNALEEERRLMYVAITRAEKALFITESEGFDHNCSGDKYPSRFLLEIQKNFLLSKGNISDNFWNETKEHFDYCKMKLDMIKNRKLNHRVYNNENIIFKIGDMVNTSFGEGEIIEEIRTGRVYKIKFGNETRSLSKCFLQLLPSSKDNDTDITEE